MVLMRLMKNWMSTDMVLRQKLKHIVTNQIILFRMIFTKTIMRINFYDDDDDDDAISGCLAKQETPAGRNCCAKAAKPYFLFSINHSELE